MLAHRRTSIPHRLGPLPSECYTMASVRTHHRESIPHRLGPLPSECYSMVSTLTCRYTLPCKCIVCRANLDCIQNVIPHRRTSIPLRLGPLPSECYTTSSMRTHHRASIPLRLGPLPIECYSMASTYECRHILHTRVFYVENISTTYKISVLSSTRTRRRESLLLRLGPLLRECYYTISITECVYSPYESNIYRAILS